MNARVAIYVKEFAKQVVLIKKIKKLILNGVLIVIIASPYALPEG